MLLFLAAPLVQAYANLTTVIISAVALWVSAVTLSTMNQQFRETAQSSDTLAALQLRNARELNDSLISQVKTLQGITNSQIAITSEQLLVSREIYRDQLYSGRPILAADGPALSDTNLVMNNKFAPKLTASFLNTGLREAKDVRCRLYCVPSDFAEIRWNGADSAGRSMTVSPKVTANFAFTPKIDVRFREDFFLVVEIRYYDGILKRYFCNSMFYQYKKFRNDFGFFACENPDKAKLQEIVTDFLKKSHQRLLGEE
jgi:hypothetical protein